MFARMSKFSPWIQPVYGAVNIEDIESPKVLEIVEKLQKELSILVFHDDQHGTSVITLAGLSNALKLVNKKIDKIIVVIAGAGFAGYGSKAQSRVHVSTGDIELVGNELIVVREGVARIRHYYIPKSYINNYDGSSVYVAAPSALVSAKFERETEPTPEEIKMLSEDESRANASS
jgi:hypothetical protein